MRIILYYLISSTAYAAAGAVILIALRFSLLKNKADEYLKNHCAAAVFFFLLTVFVILCQTIIPPQLLSGNFSLSAFHAPDFTHYRIFPKTMIGWIRWKIILEDYAEIFVNIAGNIIIFIPVGLLAPFVLKSNDEKVNYLPLGTKTVFLGFALSCAVEFVQLFIDRDSDYNDIILNTAGTLIGFLIYLLISFIGKKKIQA